MLHLGNTASDIPVLADFGECLDSGELGMRVPFSHLMSTCVRLRFSAILYRFSAILWPLIWLSLPHIT